MILHPTALDNIVNQKRIALVGPSPHLLGRGEGPYIDSYDIIARINKGIDTVIENGLQQDYGSRTDLVFNNFSRGELDEGGSLDPHRYRDHGVKLVFMTLPKSWRPEVSAGYREFIKQDIIPVIEMTDNMQKPIKEVLEGALPHAGVTAIYELAKRSIKELYITGMTFYQKPGFYLKDYHDNYDESKERSKAFYKESWGHQAGKEFSWFKELSEKDDRISTDEYLKDVLK